MNFQARSGFLDFAVIAHVQPPDMLTLPGACPFWVGIGAWPRVLDHSGHGLPPVFSQFWPSQEPSRAMASLPSGSHSLKTVVPTLGSRASEMSGPSFSE
ncbi:hypothetical protein GCM10017744_037600 [Streptomyces antimycoticus]